MAAAWRQLRSDHPTPIDPREADFTDGVYASPASSLSPTGDSRVTPRRYPTHHQELKRMGNLSFQGRRFDPLHRPSSRRRFAAVLTSETIHTHDVEAERSGTSGRSGGS
jgi:hypothetical protein